MRWKLLAELEPGATPSASLFAAPVRSAVGRGQVNAAPSLIGAPIPHGKEKEKEKEKKRERERESVQTNRQTDLFAVQASARIRGSAQGFQSLTSLDSFLFRPC